MVCLAEKRNLTYLDSQSGEDNCGNANDFRKYLGLEPGGTT